MKQLQRAVSINFSTRHAWGAMRISIQWIASALIGICYLLMTASHSNAATCTEADFDSAVDSAGANLRRFNATAMPKLKAKLKQLQNRKGWNGADDEQLALDYLHDARIASFDAKANTLLTTIDTLGDVPSGSAPDCNKLSELKAASVELLVVMKTKSTYLQKKIDDELGPNKTKRRTVAAKTGTSYETSPKTANRANDLQQRELQKPPPAPEPHSAPSAIEKQAKSQQQDQAWTVETRKSNAPASPDIGVGEKYANVPSNAPSSAPEFGGFEPDHTEGYSIDEIRQATRGFFGNVSTGLASVIEYSFQNWGRPTAYVLGTEGGGAFLAGLRYGKGNIYPRNGQSEPIYWHGPSLGYDFGAEGSRTMFLVYRLDNTQGMYRSFTGVDGSAYLVGGVGLTILKGGKVIMAPIRSGLGLRLGANIGYLRFTPRPTWNPF